MESSVAEFITSEGGLFTFTISYPGPDSFPDLRGKSVQIFGYLFQTESQTPTPDGEKTLWTVRKTKLRGASGTWSIPTTTTGQVILPTRLAKLALPIDGDDGGDGGYRGGGGGGSTGGGTVPEPPTPPVPPSTPGGGTGSGPGGGTVIVPTGGPLIVIGAIVAALAGLGVIYLIVDKVEKITESPGVNFGLFVVGLVALVFLFSAWKKGKLW